MSSKTAKKNGKASHATGPMMLSDLIASLHITMSSHGDMAVVAAIRTGENSVTLDKISKCSVTPSITGPNGETQKFLAIQNTGVFIHPGVARSVE